MLKHATKLLLIFASIAIIQTGYQTMAMELNFSANSIKDHDANTSGSLLQLAAQPVAEALTKLNPAELQKIKQQLPSEILDQIRTYVPSKVTLSETISIETLKTTKKFNDFASGQAWPLCYINQIESEQAAEKIARYPSAIQNILKVFANDQLPVTANSDSDTEGDTLYNLYYKEVSLSSNGKWLYALTKKRGFHLGYNAQHYRANNPTHGTS